MIGLFGNSKGYSVQNACEARVFGKHHAMLANQLELQQRSSSPSAGGEIRGFSTMDSSPGLLQLVHTRHAKHRSGPDKQHRRAFQHRSLGHTDP